MRALVLADTHLSPSRRRTLPREVEDALRRCDVVLHAGDVVTEHLLDDLRARVPVHAVLGNNDDDELRASLPEQLEIELGGVHVAMVHESGPRRGRPARLRRRFPDATVVVFGHSHEPVEEWHDGQLLFNPGSAVDRRRQPRCTFGVLDLARGRVAHHQIVTTG